MNVQQWLATVRALTRVDHDAIYAMRCGNEQLARSAPPAARAAFYLFEIMRPCSQHLAFAQKHLRDADMAALTRRVAKHRGGKR